MQLVELPAPGLLWSALGAAVLLLLFGSLPLSRCAGWAMAGRPALWLLAAAIAAFAIVSLRAHGRLDERLPAALEGRDIVVTGLVAQLPRNGLQGARFLFAVETASLEGRAVAMPGLLSLGWYRGAEPDALLLGPQVEVRAGQRWRFTVRLRQPHGPFNPGGFDLELWLFERGIGATGQVRARAGDAATLVAEGAGAPVERARQRVRDAIERRLAGPEQGRQGGRIAGVVAALAVGDQAAIEREDWELFRVTGVAHLMSISGLHVTMFAWLAGGAIGWLWRRSARAMVSLPAPLAARWGGVGVALAYALFAGWGVPAQRTVCMLATVAALQSLGARWPLHAVLLVTAAVVVAVDPWALQQPGFWLSFVAVGLLAASEPVGGAREPAASVGSGASGAMQVQAHMQAHLRRAATLARSALRTQAVATIGLAPLSLVFFQQVSLVGFVANLVAIPVVTLLVTPLSLLGMLIAPLWDVAALVLSSLMFLLHGLAGAGPLGLPGPEPAAGSAPWPAVWQAASAPAWAMAAGLLGGLVAVLPLPWRLRALALPLMLPLLAPAVPRPAEGRFEFVALDVGQGTAALVRTRRHLLLYDTGPALSPESDAGSRLVVPLLRRRGESHIDHLVLSHRDVDHVGGAGAVLAALPVRRLSSSLDDAHPLVARARSAGAAVHRCEAGQQWDWDGVRFEVLHPTPAEFGRPGLRSAEFGRPGPHSADFGRPGPPSVELGRPGEPAADAGWPVARSNALSCVLRVTSAETSVLLTGDIEAAQEAALRERDGARLRARVLLVPHHGSRTSSTPAFIETVAPELALAQAGYRSRFGHPAPDVVARYETRGIALARSDRCGALTLAPGGEARCEREAARRYWHHRADDRVQALVGG
ncbi:MAG: DNA internalization-related competence protein ComEC/Rec2 [Rubrivivax sp.]|nr:DNA internalization-related competence protein ComEC/Rec2 [Rubrivivax sp.]